MPEGSPGTGFDIRRLFSPGTQAREGREDPRTEPHAPVHAAPENPTPITLEDMSDQGGVGSVSKAEATLTHPSARDTNGGVRPHFGQRLHPRLSAHAHTRARESRRSASMSASELFRAAFSGGRKTTYR